MEDHLTNKDRLQKEWDTLCAYDAEPCSVVAAIEPTNMRKNRFTDILPCTRHRRFHFLYDWLGGVKAKIHYTSFPVASL